MKRDETMGRGEGVDWGTVRNKVKFAVSSGPSRMHSFLEGYRIVDVTETLKSMLMKRGV